MGEFQENSTFNTFNFWKAALPTLDPEDLQLEDPLDDEGGVCNRVLIIGPEGGGKRDLLKKMIRRTGATPTDATASTVLGHNIHQQTFGVDTKYYTANLNVTMVTLETEFSLMDQGLVQSLVEGCEAVILTFSTEQVALFPLLKGWTAFIEENEPSVVLCVAHQRSTTTETPHLKDCEDWCLENCIEFVHAPASVPTEDPTSAGFLAGELEGVARVLQALESHMWPDLKMKDAPSMSFSSLGPNPNPIPNRNPSSNPSSNPNPNSGLDSSNSNPDADADSKPNAQRVSLVEERVDTDVGAFACLSPNKRKGGPSSDCDGRLAELIGGPNPDADSDTICEGNRTEGVAGESEPALQQDWQDVAASISNPFLRELNGGGEDDDTSASAFENAFEAVTKVRAMSSNLPDSERREMAANVAMRFWTMLGGDDGEDHPSSSDDDGI